MDSGSLQRANPAGASAAADLGYAPAPQNASQKKATVDWICVAASRNVLVVDDNDRHLDILSTILRSVGNDVEACGSGAEALRRLDCRQYDVIVLDLVMPEVSGIAVATEMRKGGLNMRTPLIACTANIGIARHQLENFPGLTAIIGKPIDTASLVLAVARAPVRERPAGRPADA
jgi:CheY-like chemotaxis protein